MRLLSAAAAVLAMAAVAAPAAAQDYNATPNYGDIRLSPGFQPDPHLVVLQAGGNIQASNSINSCSGYITNAPDYRLYWDGSGSLDLIITVSSLADTTLVINGPNGEWYCDDDSGQYGMNPRVQLESASGRYEIWVGTYSSGQTQPAVLSISELDGF